MTVGIISKAMMKLKRQNLKGIAALLALAAILPVMVQAREAPRAALPGQASVSVIKEITYQRIQIADQLQVMIRIEGPFLIKTYELVAPKRLIIDFNPVSRVEAAPLTPVNDLGLLSIRTGQFQPNVARVVLDMDVRVPSHRITVTPDGVKLTFWQEPVPQAEVTPQERAADVPVEKPEKVPGAARPSFFIRGGPGLTFFLKPSFSAQTDYELYGETATVIESFDQKIRPLFDMCVGRTFGPKWSVGLGASLQFLGILSILDANLPHPFLYNQPRQVTYRAEIQPSSMWTIYAFGLYSLARTDKIDISAGLVLGFSFGTLFSLEELQVSEVPPYESADVIIDAVTFLENKFLKIDPSLLVSGSYSLNPGLSVYVTLRLHYVDVMMEEVGRRTSLFRLNALVGLQYDF